MTSTEQNNNYRTSTTTFATTTNRRLRCGKCTGCLSEDCGKCKHCVQYRKFGGDGTCNQACVNRRCIVNNAPFGGGGSNVENPSSTLPAATDSHGGEQSTKYLPTEILLSYHILQNLEPASYLIPPKKKPRTTSMMDFDDTSKGGGDDDDDDDAAPPAV